MKITKTVGQCPFCEIDTDVNNWDLDPSKNKENPIVNIYRKIVNEDGSVETLNDFKIFSDGLIKVGPCALLDYNKRVNGSRNSYLLSIVTMVTACKVFSLSTDFRRENQIALGNSIRDELLNLSDIIKSHPIQHNIVQIDDEICIPPDISFSEIGLIFNLRNQRNDGAYKIDGDDRTILGKIAYGLNGKTVGYILDDGGIFFDKELYFEYAPFRTIVTRSNIIAISNGR